MTAGSNRQHLEYYRLLCGERLLRTITDSAADKRIVIDVPRISIFRYRA